MNQPNLETHNADAVVIAQEPASSHNNCKSPVTVLGGTSEMKAKIVHGPWCNDATGFSHEGDPTDKYDDAGTLHIEAARQAAIRITAATESDIAEILSLIRGLADYEHIRPTVTEEKLRETLFGPIPAAEVLLAFVEDKCAGFAIFFPTFAAMIGRRGLFLENIFVRPEWRGAGIGEALLGRLAVIAEDRNCARIDWRCLDCNEPAIGFYKSQGAAALTDWTPFRMDAAAIRELSRKTQAKETGLQKTVDGGNRPAEAA